MSNKIFNICKIGQVLLKYGNFNKFSAPAAPKVRRLSQFFPKFSKSSNFRRLRWRKMCNSTTKVSPWGVTLYDSRADWYSISRHNVENSWDLKLKWISLRKSMRLNIKSVSLVFWATRYNQRRQLIASNTFSAKSACSIHYIVTKSVCHINRYDENGGWLSITTINILMIRFHMKYSVIMVY